MNETFLCCEPRKHVLVRVPPVSNGRNRTPNTTSCWRDAFQYPQSAPKSTPDYHFHSPSGMPVSTLFPINFLKSPSNRLSRQNTHFASLKTDLNIPVWTDDLTLSWAFLCGEDAGSRIAISDISGSYRRDRRQVSLGQVI